MLALIALGIGLIIASITDLKKREVPDWLNFALIAFGIMNGLLQSILQYSYVPFFSTLLGLGIGWAIGAALYYTGQWGGGDTKLLMAAGASFGVSFVIQDRFLAFLLNLIIFGSLYGLIGMIALSFRNRKQLLKSLHFNSIAKMILILILANYILAYALNVLHLWLSAIVLSFMFFSWYLLTFSKIVEKVCMLQLVNPMKVTEGDWIAKPIIVDKKVIASPKDLGISKQSLRLLYKAYREGKLSNVLIKVGIPFAPSFLIAYVVTIVFGNVLLMILRYAP